MTDEVGDRSNRDHWIDVFGFSGMAFLLGFFVSEARARRLVAEALSRWTGTIGSKEPPELREIISRVDHIGQLATRDSLTGVANRVRLLEELSRAAATANELAAWLGLCMVDLDHFKDVNDTYGHDSGDVVLLAVAERMQQQTEMGELLGRLGGEEFLIVLPKHDSDQSEARAERIRRAIEADPIQLPDGRAVTVTASVGVAATYGERCRPETLRAAADRALYLAKESGRNAVRHAEVSAPTNEPQP